MTEKGRINGCGSIPTCKVIKTSGCVKKVKVYTTQVIVTVKFFVRNIVG